MSGQSKRKKSNKIGLIARMSIVQQVTITTITIVFIGLFSFGAIILNDTFKRNAQAMDREIKRNVQIALRALPEPIWNYDQKTLDEIVEAFLGDEIDTVIAVRVNNDERKGLSFRRSKKLQGLSFDEIATGRNRQIVKANIMYESRKIAEVEFVFSNERFSEQILEQIMLLILGAIFIAGTLSLLVYFRMRSLLSVPLTKLILGAGKIEDGDYNIHFDEGYAAELGQISTAFNASVKAIFERDSRLKEYADNLEQQVMQRTRELDDQRAKNIAASRMVSLGEMSTGIAHEINNPLTVIEGQVLLGRRFLKIGKEPAEILAVFDKISNMAHRISKIIKGLRSFARDGNQDPKIDVSIDSMISDIKDLCLTRMKNTGIEFSTQIQNPNMTVHCREVQISQVLINLINNSVDAISERDEKWIRLEVSEDEANTYFRVLDSGGGISPEVQRKLMQPFFTTKEVGKGTGLGLSISLGIVRDHGGELVYEDTVGVTKFMFYLPRSRGI